MLVFVDQDRFLANLVPLLRLIRSAKSAHYLQGRHSTSGFFPLIRLLCAGESNLPLSLLLVDVPGWRGQLR